MQRHVTSLVFAAFLLSATSHLAVAAAPADDEAAIRQTVQDLQDGWNQKNGAAFAAPFAAEHAYVAIHGLFLPRTTREKNAAAHQQLFDGVYREVDLQLRLAQVRFLSPEIAVAHLQGHSHPKGKPDEKSQEVVITGVLKKGPEGWKIEAFQNTPVQPRRDDASRP